MRSSSLLTAICSRRLGEGGENYVSKWGWINRTCLSGCWAHPLLEHSWLCPRSAPPLIRAVVKKHRSKGPFLLPRGSCFLAEAQPWPPPVLHHHRAAVMPTPRLLLLQFWPWPIPISSAPWLALGHVLLLWICLVTTQPCLIRITAPDPILPWTGCSAPWSLVSEGSAPLSVQEAPDSLLAFQRRTESHSLIFLPMQNPSETALALCGHVMKLFMPSLLFAMSNSRFVNIYTASSVKVSLFKLKSI